MEKNHKSDSPPGYESQDYPPQASSENYPPPYAPQIAPLQNYPFQNNPLKNYQPKNYLPQNGIHNPPFTHVNYPTAAVQANINAQTQPVNIMGAIIMSCVVFWICGGAFGGIAFIYAMIGQSEASNGNNESARHMTHASFILSFVGILSGIVVIIALSVAFSKMYKLF